MSKLELYTGYLFLYLVSFLVSIAYYITLSVNLSLSLAWAEDTIPIDSVMKLKYWNGELVFRSVPLPYLGANFGDI